MPMLFPNFGAGSGSALGTVFTQQPYAIFGAVNSGGMVREQGFVAVTGAVNSGGMVRTHSFYAVLEGDL